MPAPPGSGVSKSATSRRFVARARLADFMAADLSALDLLVVQIDGLHLGDDLVLVAAIGVDGGGNKHPLALVEGATENAATVQALLDNLVSRGLAPRYQDCSSPTARKRCRRRSAAPSVRPLRSSAARSTRRATSWKACQKSIMRPPIGCCARPRSSMTPKAERLIRNLARRLDQQWPGVAASILEGLDEILTVVRSKLPKELRQSPACTNIAENMMGTIRRVTRNVKRWRDAGMALLWVAAHANTPVTALVVIGRQSVVRDDRFCWRFVSLWSGSRFRQVKLSRHVQASNECWSRAQVPISHDRSKVPRASSQGGTDQHAQLRKPCASMSPERRCSLSASIGPTQRPAMVGFVASMCFRSARLQMFSQAMNSIACRSTWGAPSRRARPQSCARRTSEGQAFSRALELSRVALSRASYLRSAIISQPSSRARLYVTTDCGPVLGLKEEAAASLRAATNSSRAPAPQQ